MNYWRTRKCISKPSECPLKSPAFTGLHEKAPLGLMDTPLLDTEEEVHYCFLPLDLVEKYPLLVNDDNLLWLSDNAVLIECEGGEFRFIANFLRSEKILLPENFSSLDVLEAEAEALGIPEVIEAVKICRRNPGVHSEGTCDLQSSAKSTVQKQLCGQEAARLPLYPMTLGLLVKYPDSALGQLHMESTLDGNKLYISGNGVLFQHVRNWLGTCKLPLTQNISELPKLCAYLDQMDITYEPMKDALKMYLKQKAPTDTMAKDADWAAAISAFSRHHIVKVYVGNHWYATYLQTLLKFPELLLNCKKVCWIAYGQSLLIHGDGPTFRHVLNFLRLGKLFLPSEFKEWSLLCQEVMEYQIPALVEALNQYDMYRLWVQQQQAQSGGKSLDAAVTEKGGEPSEDPQEHSHITMDLKQEASHRSPMRDAPGTEESSRGNEKYTRISPAKAAKRRTSWEGHRQATDGWASAFCYGLSGSPPRKRGAKGNLTKPLEKQDTPIQKLISLVQGWDMVNCRRCEAQQVPLPGGITAEETPERSPCRLPPTRCLELASPEPPSSSPAAPRLPGGLLEAGQGMPRGPASEDWLEKPGRHGASEEMCPAGGAPARKVVCGQREGVQGTWLEQASAMLGEPHSSTSLILKVEHPPVVACDGSCTAHQGSILYSTRLEDVKLAQPVTNDIVFLSFPLSQEEIFYARKCHCFLTDVILDSIRQKDPKETTAKVELLVRKLWSLQITAKEFVADLLQTAPFKADTPACDKLLRWVEFTLPFAWKYSCCMDLLIKRGYFKSLSHFVIGKYLQKS
ncbi:BTB/POZ domain-containing protein KCTD19 [Varanus komodoensis]|uniref:BTB/POZ domain-containing protein KCTD19 n=1 Tax=Varanus komodoensis TaxID=61221 RepID=UPI001CF78BED|nr:BTB/POZ domain-containing protein KCTD19 [Varanus komodoensis]